MEQQEFDDLVATPEILVKKIQESKDNSKILDWMKQYDPETHDVMDSGKRPNKIVDSVDNEKGPSTSSVDVSRIPVPFQKKIVGLAAAFLCGIPIKLASTPANPAEEAFMAVFKRTWDNNKLDYDSKAIAELQMSETEAAEIWYTEPAEQGYWADTANEIPSVKFKLRMKIVANSLGDSLFPVFNSAGDMIAFGRGYTVQVGKSKVEHFDIYTDTKILAGVKEQSDWTFTPTTNIIGKIPIIYYKQPKPEWSDVQWMIDRFEKVISNHGDTNDYYVSPMVFVEGEIEGFAKKGEQGKVLQGKNGAKASYLTWDQSPESLKLEFNNLWSLIHSMSDTPDLSPEAIRQLPSFANIDMQIFFLCAHLKAAKKEENFGKSMQRRINYLKAALGVINVKMKTQVNMSIKPVFEYYLPKNVREIIDILNTATGGKPTLSMKSAVKQNPLVTDPDNEITQLQEEGADTQINL
jgi:SPP1 family phage portal protein